MRFEKLSEKSITIWRIRATLVLIIWWFICGCTAVFSFWAAVVMAAVGSAVYLSVILWFLKIFYKQYVYCIGKHSITIQKGVIIAKKIHIDRSRLQYSQMYQTPLQRIYGTCTIAYQAAGAVVYLSQIDTKYANGAMFK